MQSKFPLSEPCIEDEQNQKDITAGINDADVDKLMPPVSRFGGGNWAEKKQGIIEKLMRFFERFFGIA